MPWDPSEHNQVPGIIQNTANSLQGDWQAAMQRMDEEKRKDSTAEGILQAIQSDPQGSKLVTPQLLQQFAGANGDKRMGLVGVLASGLNDQRQAANQQQSQQAQAARQAALIGAEQPLRAAQTAEAAARATALGQGNLPPNTKVGDPVFYNGKQVGEYTKTGPSYFPAQILKSDNGPIPLDPIFGDDGKMVPGKRINRLTGQEINVSGNSNVVNLDPTGHFWTDQRGNQHEISAENFASMQRAKKAAMPPPPAQPGILSQIFGGATPAPSATPDGQPAAPAQGGVTIQNPAAAPPQSSMIRIQGPNGVTGSFPRNKPIPPGWTQVQ